MLADPPDKAPAKEGRWLRLGAWATVGLAALLYVLDGLGLPPVPETELSGFFAPGGLLPALIAFMFILWPLAVAAAVSQGRPAAAALAAALCALHAFAFPANAGAPRVVAVLLLLLAVLAVRWGRRAATPGSAGGPARHAAPPSRRPGPWVATAAALVALALGTLGGPAGALFVLPPALAAAMLWRDRRDLAWPLSLGYLGLSLQFGLSIGGLHFLLGVPVLFVGLALDSMGRPSGGLATPNPG